MPFLTALALVLLIQWLHWRLLRLELPDRTHRALPWVLLALHLPLIAYGVLRAVGLGGITALPAVRTLGRAGFYFQALTVLHLLFALAAQALWRLVRRVAPEEAPEEAPLEPGRRAFLRTAALASAGTALALGARGSREAYGDPEITRHEVAFPDLPPGLDGLRIAHLSDLHAGPLVGAATLARWRLLAERERPDLAAFTGDLVDTRPEELADLLGAFQGFEPPLGRFVVLGNHDYFEDPRPIWKALAQAGYRCLENEAEVVVRAGDRLAVMGLQDPMARNGRFRRIPFGPGPRPQQATRHVPADAFRLCLNHRPSEWEAALAAGARLTLSGHTHGGQINLVPGISSARLIGPRTEGFFRQGGQVLYVSRGLGVVGLPVRLGARPELAILTLRRG